MKKLGPARRGFTLIELMLVSAIIGLLAAVAIPRFANLIDKAKEASLKGSMGALRSALTLYYADNDGYYPKFRMMAPISYGIYVLHPKYIDLNQISFRPPRYAGNFPDRTAMQAYSPTGGLMEFLNEDDYAPNPISCVHYWGPYPSYYVWAPAVWSKGGTYGHLGMSAANRIDTKGIDWSLW